MTIEATLDEARRLDAADPLARFRDAFHIPKRADGEDVIYFCGNSLGLQPKATQHAMTVELEDWATMGVDGHFDGRNPWYDYHEALARPAAHIVGASEEEVVLMNGLTVNLHLMMVSFYRPNPERYRIVVEEGAFPSDQYAVDSQARFHGFDPKDAIVELAPREGESTLRTEDIVAAIEREGDKLALVMLGGVNYYTGQFFDLQAITAAAHAAGAVAGFDLAHAAGNVVLQLHDWDVDFAVWCTYKYLNSGPGSVSGAFVHERHRFAPELPRFSGWWGTDPKTRFAMAREFVPHTGAGGWQLSNAPVFSMAPFRVSGELFLEATMTELRKKSVALTGYLEALVRRLPDGLADIITPAEPNARGCQLSLHVHADGKALQAALQKDGVVADFRPPNVVRVAPVPLYNTFEDVFRFAEILRSMSPSGRHQ